MSAIFISHSSKDNVVAEQVKTRLQEQGYNFIFLDFDPMFGIPAGRNWQKELYLKLRTCYAVIVLCSEHSIDSNWCFAEITQALALGKPVFALRIGPCEIWDLLKSEQTVDLTVDPEGGYTRLWRGLREKQLDPGRVFYWDGVRTPFPGLRPFEEKDAAVFFGRDDESQRIIERLNSLRDLGDSHLLLVTGASGAGKSSLVRARILPLLKRDPEHWIVPEPIRPADTGGAFVRLAVAFAKATGRLDDWKELCTQLEEPVNGREDRALIDLALRLQVAADQTAASVLITIDQAEELFTGNQGNSTEDFLRLIRSMMEVPNSPFYIIATLRSDFLAEFRDHIVLRDLRDTEVVHLSPFHPEHLAEVIENPARVAGIELEEGLVQAMVTETGTVNLLPLLAFVLEQLWEGCKDKEPKRFTWDGYKKAGQLKGSINHVAEEVYKRVVRSSEQETSLRRVLLSMVQLGEQEQLLRRAIKPLHLPLHVQEVLEQFVHKRLLVAYGEGEERIIEVAHETIFQSWERLAKWLDEEREFLLWPRRFHSEVDNWKYSNYDDKALLAGVLLVKAEDWLAKKPDYFTTEEEEYILLSRRFEEQEKQRWKELSQRYLAGRLAAEAELARQESPRLLPRSILLAIEAMRRWPSPQAHQALRRGLSLLPRPVNLMQHQSSVETIVFSPQGQWLASGSQDGVIRVWEVQTGYRIAEVKHDAQVNGLAFSPDERWLAAASNDKTVRVWEVGTWRLEASLPHEEAVLTVAFSPDGTLLLSTTCSPMHSGQVRLWNVAHWKETVRANHLMAARFRPWGELVVSAKEDQVAVWEPATGNSSAISLQDGAVLAVDYHPVHNLIAATTFNESLWVWGQFQEEQSQGNSSVRTVHEKIADSISLLSPVVFSPDGQWLAALGKDFSVRVWEAATLKVVRRFPGLGEDGGIKLVFNPSGQLLASVWLEHQSVCIWNVYTGQTIACMEQDQATAVCFSPDGKRMASASDRNAARIWELPAPGGVIWTIFADLPMGLRFSGGGKWLALTGASAGPDGAFHSGDIAALLKLLETQTGQEVWSFQHDAPIEAVAFSPEGQWIASVCGDTVRVWEAATGQEKSEMRQEAQKWLGSVIQKAKEHSTAAVSSDGKWLATVSRREPEEPYRLGQRETGIIQIREASTGLIRNELRFGGDTTAMAFSPEGHYFASGHADGIIRLWDTRNWHELTRLEHHAAQVTALAFNSQGNCLASASYDGSTRLWLVKADDLVNEACSRLTRNLTREEWQHYMGDEEPYRRTCPELPGEEES